MKQSLALLLVVVFSLTLFVGITFAQPEEIIKWSEEKTAVYDKLHPFTLNWSGDVLDKGGMVLSSMTTTDSSTEADFVINQYGAMGSNGIIERNEDLQTDTSTNVSGFVNSVTIKKDATYLIVLHDGKYAKIRIDRFLPEQGISITKVFFTYVVEMERVKVAQQPAPTPAATPTPTPVVTSAPTAKPQVPVNGGTTDGVWSNDYEVPGGYQYVRPFSIYLLLNSNKSTIYKKDGTKLDYKLHAVPTLYQDRTMVPLRFVAEALGAKIEWHEADQSITILYGETKISLWIDRNQANVNGIQKELDAAPYINGEYTMVPLRFISENFSMLVYYNSGMILITDTKSESFESDLTKIDDSKTVVQTNDASGLYGRWNLWISGNFNTEGEYVYGADADWIEINGDGTYKWRYLGNVIEGTWYDSGTPGIIMLAGNQIVGSDWNMRLESEDTALIYAWGIQYKASK